MFERADDRVDCELQEMLMAENSLLLENSLGALIFPASSSQSVSLELFIIKNPNLYNPNRLRPVIHLLYYLFSDNVQCLTGRIQNISV